jgi:SAM-dependent methyltransferase
MVFRNMLKYIYDHFYTKIFPNYQVELEKAIGSCKTVLDVGCGSLSPIKPFSKKFYSVGVDAFEPSIKRSRKQKIHDEYYKMDILDIGKKFKSNSFDCVLASDVIEHLTKNDGLKLLRRMEKIAKNKVIIFTPNGFLPQGAYEDNPWQVHKSGWSVREMKRKGYKIVGINGWKPLRGESAAIRFWPKYFWMIVSDITQWFVRNNPEKAFQILCIKTKRSYKVMLRGA